MDEKFKGYLKTLLKLTVTAVALYVVFRKIKISDILSLYRQSNLFYLFIALFLFVASKLASALRLNIFFARAGLRLDHATNIRLYLLGMFYNLFLPGGIGGDGYKVYILQKAYQTGVGRLIGAVLIDRVSGMVAIWVMALIMVPFLNLQVSYISFTFLLAPVALIALYFLIRWFYRYFLDAYWVTNYYSMIVQLLQTFSAWFIFKSLGGREHELAYMVIFLASSIVAVLPFTIGGVGARELTFLYGSQLMHMDINLAVGLSFIFYIITAVVSFWGIYYVIRPIAIPEKTQNQNK